MDVTPTKFPISVNGNMTDIQAKAANDPLHARCLVLDDGKTKLAIVVVDSCMLPRELVEDAKAQANKLTGIPADHMLISATHTHSAPTVTGVFQSEPDADYVKYLPTKIAEGIETAHDRRVPARVGFGRVKDESQLFNRRWKREHGLIPPDPFGNTTDKVQMNPGNQAKGLVEPAGPGRSGHLTPVGPDGRRQAAVPAGELLAALRRRQPGRCRPTTSGRLPIASSNSSHRTRRTSSASCPTARAGT